MVFFCHRVLLFSSKMCSLELSPSPGDAFVLFPLSPGQLILDHQLDLILDWYVVVPLGPVVSVQGVHGLPVHPLYSHVVARSCGEHLVRVPAELLDQLGSGGHHV